MDMSIESIEKTLRDRFAAPLKDFHKRRIIFWHDSDGEFSEMLDSLHLPDVKILRLTGSNNFLAKKTLLIDDAQSNYLVYNPLRYASVKDNWLLDIQCYSEEFRADLLSMRMQELGMTQTTELRKAMRLYSEFFDSKERVAKLTAFRSEYYISGQLHLDVLSVLTGAKSNTVSAIIRAVLAAGADAEENEPLANIRKFGSEDVFRKLVENHTGFQCKDGTNLDDLAAHILLTALSVTMPSVQLPVSGQLISEAHKQNCYALIDEWMHSDADNALYDIAREVEEKFELPSRFDRMEVSELIGSECFPCIDESILRRFMTEIAENVIKIEDITAAVEKRRTMKWYKPVRHYYDGLLQVAQMQRFYQQNIGGFHIAEYEKLWQAYCENYCQMDAFYRRFHTAFGRSLKESCTALEDLYKGVAAYVEKLYKNWYLEELSAQWNRLISDELSRDARLPHIPQQERFYQEYVKSLSNAGRTYVFISDALRYEVAADLTEQLLRETKGSAKISAMQSVFPSVTKFGMAALLPHRNLEFTEDGRVLCDGQSTDGTENRSRILSAAHKEDVAVSYKMLLSMTKAEHDALIGGARVVYIYHNTIDAVGDKAATEDRVFEACEEAIAEIKGLVRRITNTFKGTNVLITADHGFLYSYSPLVEHDKTEKSHVSGEIVELERRYVLLRGECTAERMQRIPMKHLQSELVGFTPLQAIRIRKSGGMNYVHGGISLQECVVPVITFKNLRSNSKSFVDIQKADLQLISRSRKVSNSIFSLDFYQKEPVGGKRIPAEYEIYMADADGKAVSNRQTIIADKTSPDASERLFRIRLTLRSMEFQKTQSYYLTMVENATANVVDKTEFTIDIAFASDFDF